MNDRLARWLGALAALCIAGAAAAQDGPQKLPQIRLNAGIHNINAELAATPEQREIGLMFRPRWAPTTACCSSSSAPASSASG